MLLFFLAFPIGDFIFFPHTIRNITILINFSVSFITNIVYRTKLVFVIGYATCDCYTALSIPITQIRISVYASYDNCYTDFWC